MQPFMVMHGGTCPGSLWEIGEGCKLGTLYPSCCIIIEITQRCVSTTYITNHRLSLYVAVRIRNQDVLVCTWKHTSCQDVDK